MKRVFTLLAGVALLLQSCTQSSQSSGYSPGKAGKSEGTFEVNTSLADLGTLTIPIQARGKIRSGYEEQIRAQLGGLVVSCTVKNGRRVKKGEVLISVGTEVAELRKERLMAQLFHAQKEYESQCLGYEALLKEKSPREAEEVRQKLRIATGLAALEIDLREVAREIGLSAIKAPVDGILSEVAVVEGMTLLPGQELFRIYDPEYLYLEARVPETDLPRLSIGMSARIVPVASAEQSRHAILEAIDPQVGADAMVKVHLRLKDTKGLFPGMNALAGILVPQRQGVLVPRQALVLRDDRPVVFTVEKGRAKWNYVRLGAENGEWLEILEGVSAGDEVIISNHIQLAHQAMVVPVRSTSNLVVQ
ncbi:MAG: efflux RND transporter periplasmic adaptor subunit [Saprospiraceae bacterium]|jgi:membrane fusion protein (multidrug efflux system)